MTHLKILRLPMLSALLVCGLAGCSTSDPEKSGSTAAGSQSAFAAPTDLTGTLTPDGHIELSWKNNATEPGGTWVEFTTPGSDFVKLDPLWPEQTSYRHPDVAPDAKYLYRLLPFFGRPSEAASAITGAAPPEGTPNRDEEGPLPETESKPAAAAPKKSVRDPATTVQAAPDGVTAALFSPTTIDVRWQDRASDEDGYVLEISADPAQGFRICALLPPDTTSFRKPMLPPETKCYFRARAFFYGKPSKQISVNTGPERPQKPAMN